MQLSEVYEWEVGLTDGTVLKNKRKGFDPKMVERVTLVPRTGGLPIREFNFNGDFVKMFGRGFLRQKLNFQLGEYLHCIITDTYRVWVHCTNGEVLTTGPDEEVYL